MTEVAVVLAMLVAVAGPKVVPMLVMPGDLPSPVRRWLAYIAPAVLSALVAPSILAPGGRLTLDWLLLGYAGALVMAVLTRGMLRSLAAGLLVVVGLSLLKPATGL